MRWRGPIALVLPRFTLSSTCAVDAPCSSGVGSLGREVECSEGVGPSYGHDTVPWWHSCTHKGETPCQTKNKAVHGKIPNLNKRCVKLRTFFGRTTGAQKAASRNTGLRPLGRSWRSEKRAIRKWHPLGRTLFSRSPLASKVPVQGGGPGWSSENYTARSSSRCSIGS